MPSFLSSRLLVALLWLIPGCLFAQEHVNYYFVKNGSDTVLCKSIVWRRSEVRKHFSFVRWGEENEEVIKAGDFSPITTVFLDGFVHERVPYDPDKPDGRTMMAQRIANGRLKLYHTTRDLGTTTQIYLVARTPANEYLDVTRKDLEKKLNPLLEKCAAYREAHTAPFEWRMGKDWTPQVEDMIRRVNTYNVECP